MSRESWQVIQDRLDRIEDEVCAIRLAMLAESRIAEMKRIRGEAATHDLVEVTMRDGRRVWMRRQGV